MKLMVSSREKVHYVLAAAAGAVPVIMPSDALHLSICHKIGLQTVN